MGPGETQRRPKGNLGIGVKRLVKSAKEALRASRRSLGPPAAPGAASRTKNALATPNDTILNI